MSAQKEEAKQRKRKSLKMALEKCMQRREAASTTISTITTNTNSSTNTNTNTNTTLTALTTTSTTTTINTNPTSTSSITATTEAITTYAANSMQKRMKANVGHDMEAQETTETETSMDTSAEVNASDICESREEDLESETSINSAVQSSYRLQQEEVKSMQVVEYDDKPLDFTTTPTKKSKEANNDNENENENEAKDVEAYLKSTAVIKETAKVLDCGNNDNKLEQIEKKLLDKEKEKVKNSDSDKSDELQETSSASLKEN